MFLGSVPVQVQQFSADLVKTSSGLNSFVSEAIIFSNKKGRVLKAGSYSQDRNIIPVSCVQDSLWSLPSPEASQTIEELENCVGNARGMTDLKLPWICSPLKSVPVHVLLTGCEAEDRGGHTFFCCPSLGPTIRLMPAQRLAVTTDHASPKEDKKPCPTRNNLGLIFRTKTSQKGLAEPPSPAQHHGGGTGVPAARAHRTLGGGKTTVQQYLC